VLYEIRMRTLLQGNLGGHDPKSRLRFFFVVSRETSKSSLNSMSVKLEPASPQDRIGIFTVAIFGQPTQSRLADLAGGRPGRIRAKRRPAYAHQTAWPGSKRLRAAPNARIGLTFAPKTSASGDIPRSRLVGFHFRYLFFERADSAMQDIHLTRIHSFPEITQQSPESRPPILCRCCFRCFAHVNLLTPQLVWQPSHDNRPVALEDRLGPHARAKISACSEPAIRKPRRVLVAG